MLQPLIRAMQTLLSHLLWLSLDCQLRLELPIYSSSLLFFLGNRKTIDLDCVHVHILSCFIMCIVIIFRSLR